MCFGPKTAPIKQPLQHNVPCNKEAHREVLRVHIALGGRVKSHGISEIIQEPLFQGRNLIFSFPDYLTIKAVSSRWLNSGCPLVFNYGFNLGKPFWNFFTAELCSLRWKTQQRPFLELGGGGREGCAVHQASSAPVLTSNTSKAASLFCYEY